MKIRGYQIEKCLYFELGNQFCLIPTVLIDRYSGDIEFTFQWLFLTISCIYVFNDKTCKHDKN